MLLATLSVALACLHVQSCVCSGFLLAVKRYTDIDYVSEVKSSAKFESSKSGFVQGTVQNPCEPPIKCVEFYPQNRSLLIKGGILANYCAVVLTPEDPDLAQIAMVVVTENDFFPALHDVHFTKPITTGSPYSTPVSAVIDGNIKEVKLLGNISKYPSRSARTGLQIIAPYERVNGGKHKLMRVTGRIETEALEFFLTDDAGNREAYTFLPMETADYVEETGRKLQTRLHEHKLATRRLDPNSQLAAHIGETGHSFDFQGATVLGRGTSRTERLTLEAWYSDANSINRHLDLPSAYKVLRHFIRLDEDKTVVRTLGLPSKHGLSTNSPKRGRQTQLTPIEVTTPNRGGHQQSKATASRPRQRKKRKIDQPKAN
ncbi:hypothetical protein SprV_0702331800 [Sparganum proliferum]